MSFDLYDAVPPTRKVSNVTNLRGRISTVYTKDTPSLSVQEPTPELTQAEFDSALVPKKTHSLPTSELVPKSPNGKDRPTPPSPARSQYGTPDVFSTPTHSRTPSTEKTPKPLPSRRDSIPVRLSPSRVAIDAKPLTVSCESCQSRHTIQISESDRVSVLSCNVTPPPPTPSPTVLELYKLPGYLTLNESGQILVKTEAELMSYIRKIFAPAEQFAGDFPSSRKFNIGTFGSPMTDVSMTSTPESARASYALGHSHYRGTYHDKTDDTSKKSSKAVSSVHSAQANSPRAQSRSPSRGPLEPYVSPPAVPTTTKPYTEDSRPRGRPSSLAFVQTVVPSDVTRPSPTSPRHASRSRQASPRNLRSIGIFSDSEPDLPIPTQYETADQERILFDTSRPTSRSQSRHRLEVRQPSELYSQSAEISQEMSAEVRPSRSRSPQYSTRRVEPSQ